MNGKGKGPEKGRNLERYRAGHDAINWRRPVAPPTQPHTDQKKQDEKTRCRGPLVSDES